MNRPISILLLLVLLCSCSADKEPTAYETDVYTISFTGDVDAFHGGYCIYYSSDAYLYDLNHKVIKSYNSDFNQGEEQFFFDYKSDGEKRFIVISGSALCFTDSEPKYLQGLITREHNGDIVDIATFEIHSFKPGDRPEVDEYSFNFIM